MVQFINNSIQFLKSRDSKMGLPKGIYLIFNAAAIGGLIYGAFLVNSIENSFEKRSEALYIQNVLNLCDDYGNNLRLSREMGHPDIAEKMEEVCEETLEGFIR